MSDENKTDAWQWIQTRGLWLGVPLLLGILLAAFIPRPVVGVIYLSDAIYAYTARDLNAQLKYASESPNIRAVVLVLDSPGGTVADTEAVYLELLKLRQTKPVVVSINTLAASGAYYLTAGADYAFAKPTSSVGNIGVIGYLPSEPGLLEETISTGPYKLWGFPRDTYIRQIEMIKQGFWAAVQAGRGDRLAADQDTVLSGQIWPGIEALRMGLVDELGGESDAIRHAAEMAHISNYEILNLSTVVSAAPAEYSFFMPAEQSGQLPYPRNAGVYLLYIPPTQLELP